MCPLRLIQRLFVFDEEELTPEMRAQRTLNKARVPEMARYILDNPAAKVAFAKVFPEIATNPDLDRAAA